jgi:hypothetical protein
MRRIKSGRIYFYSSRDDDQGAIPGLVKKSLLKVRGQGRDLVDAEPLKESVARRRLVQEKVHADEVFG